MSPALRLVTACLLLPAAGCSRATESLLRPPDGVQPELVRLGLPAPRAAGAYVVDAGGRPIRTLESGSTLHVGAQALQPNALYEFAATIDGRAVTFARVTTDHAGRVDPFVLWYEAGVVGCTRRRVDGPDRERFRFRTFEEAESALAGRVLTITAQRVTPDRGRPAELRAGPAETTIRLPVAVRHSPMVFPSDSSGCLTNAQPVGRADMYVRGRNFTPGEVVEISVVPNQRAWYVGDLVVDVTGPSAAAAPERVTVGHDGRFTVLAWPRAAQFRGAFDIVAQRAGAVANRLGPNDLVSFDRETGFLLSLDYPIGGPHMDLAGRPLGRPPYFEFADAFAETNDPVWGAVDPTYVPAGHPGGTWAAYYVVAHKTDAQWLADNSLTDVTPGIEIHPVKAGCVNGTDVIIWDAPLALGSYDVVVEFGSAVANNAASFSGDGHYDPAVDFLDGGVQVGFQVARDPWALGSIPVGSDSYSQDDYFATLGGATNVDLRAVVRYPATAPGAGTPVAPGTHPIFIIEHGNHSLCTVLTDGTPWYQALAAVYAGTMTWADFSAKQYTHASCPSREPNHLGYTRLLETLAGHGVIAVSIDAYDLTGPVPSWIVERGQLILRHLELWSHMNDAATFSSYPDFFAGRFAGKVDFTRVAVSGHSRGGEASVSAYMQNAASMNPFSIGSVSSIAPVDNLSYTLPAVPYFVILPAADCDVSDLSGQGIYDRAGSGIADATTKSATYVYGANHDFFNTVWAADWDDCNPNPARQDFIAAASQQRIGEAVLAAFHRSALLGESVYDDMLRGRLVFPSTASYKVYAERHEANHVKLLSGGVLGGQTAAGGAMLASANNPSPHQTLATQIGWPAWGASVTYTVPVGQRDATGFEVLSFRVAQTPSAANPAGTNQDFQIELVGGGVTRGVFVGQFNVIPPRYPHPFGLVHTVMTTIRVPLHSFIMNNSGLTLNNVDTIRFRFLYPATGELYVDDVEFSR